MNTSPHVINNSSFPAVDYGTTFIFTNRAERGMKLSIYNGLVMVLKIVMLLAKMWMSWVYAIYQIVVPPAPKSVEGEIVLITGAGHGMGREVALRFGRLGAVVVCVDINAAGNQETVDTIKANNGQAHHYVCDVSDCKAVAALAERVRIEVGDVTVLVNNAGLMPFKRLLQHNEEEIRRMFEVNVLAHFWMLQNFLPSMMERNYGHIAAMSSMAGLLGTRNMVPYSASKFAVRGLMDSLREELREDKRDYSGIKTTVIYPYIVDTGVFVDPIQARTALSLVTAGHAADSIVDAIRRNYTEISIPCSLYYLSKVLSPLPLAVKLQFKDFVGTGLSGKK